MCPPIPCFYGRVLIFLFIHFMNNGINFSDKLIDIFVNIIDKIGQLSDFSGNHRKASAVLPGSCRFGVVRDCIYLFSGFSATDYQRFRKRKRAVFPVFGALL